jgi:hypothetical protein
MSKDKCTTASDVFILFYTKTSLVVARLQRAAIRRFQILLLSYYYNYYIQKKLGILPNGVMATAVCLDGDCMFIKLSR